MLTESLGLPSCSRILGLLLNGHGKSDSWTIAFLGTFHDELTDGCDVVRMCLILRSGVSGRGYKVGQGHFEARSEALSTPLGSECLPLDVFCLFVLACSPTAPSQVQSWNRLNPIERDRGNTGGASMVGDDESGADVSIPAKSNNFGLDGHCDGDDVAGLQVTTIALVSLGSLRGVMVTPALLGEANGATRLQDDEEEAWFADPAIEVWQRTQSFPGAINTSRTGLDDLNDKRGGDIGQNFTVLRWQGQSLAIYASGDALIVLDETLSLICTIPVVPHLRQRSAPRTSSSQSVIRLGGVCCDASRGLIYTWTANEIVCFTPLSSGSSRARAAQGPTWKLYGTLSLSTDARIQCLDVSIDQGDPSSDETLLLLGTLDSLELWTGDLFGPVPIWTRKWTRPYKSCVKAILSSERTFVAWHTSADRKVQVQALARDFRLQGIPQGLEQPRNIRWIQWSRQNDDSLYVVGAEGVVRIWSPVLDDPTWFQLCYSVSIREPAERVRAPRGGARLSTRAEFAFAIASFEEMQDDSRRSVESARSGDDSRSVRARRQRSRTTSESILWLTATGQVKCIAVDGLDRRPPELLVVQKPTTEGKVDLVKDRVTKWDRLCVLPTRDKPHNCLLVSADKLQPVASLRETCRPCTWLGESEAIETLEYDATRRQVSSFTCDRRRVRRLQDERSGAFRHLDTRTAAKVAATNVRTSTPRIRIVQDATEAVQVDYLPRAGESWTQYALPTERSKESRLIFIGETQSEDLHPGLFALSSDGSARSFQFEASGHAELRAETRMPPDMTRVIASDPPIIRLQSYRADTAIQVVDQHGVFTSWRWASRPGSTWTLHATFPTGSQHIKGVVDIDSSHIAVLDITGNLSIWDIRAQEFCQGPKYLIAYPDNPIEQITPMSDELGLPCLALTTPHEIQILSSAPLLTDLKPSWRVHDTLPTSVLSSGSVEAMCSAGSGTVAIAQGNQLHIFRPQREQRATPKLPALPEYHPRSIAMVLMSGERRRLTQRRATDVFCASDRLDLASNIGSRLQTALKAQSNSLEPSATPLPYEPVDALHYLDAGQDVREDAADQLPDATVSLSRIGLSPSSQPQLRMLIGYVAEMLTSRLQADACGMKYLAMLALRQAQHSETPSKTHADLLSAGQQVVWAYYSRSQQALVDQTIRATANGKLLLQDAARSGLFLWLYDKEQLRLQAETIAANEYVTADRNPIACSLIYFALGKKSTVYSLWKQAHGHGEQGAMLKFLANDFSQARWQTAAKKNAYALLAKQRFAYAAAFFVLAGSHRDAINVCVRNHGDLSLGLLLARLLDSSDDLLVYAVREYLLPVAFTAGNRWLAHWALMTVSDYGAAMQAIVSPIHRLAEGLKLPLTDAPLRPVSYEPTLALLLAHVKTRSRTAQHYRDVVSIDQEYRFVLYCARGFWRQGESSSFEVTSC